MSSIVGTAPAKVILFGEHSVVYGQPAIAVPVNQVGATAKIFPNTDNHVRIFAPDIHLDCKLTDLAIDHPIYIILNGVKSKLDMEIIPPCEIHITSSIPIASGLGSGAAISVAIIRSLLAFLGVSLSNQIISDLAFEAEKIYHGNPSGIDNTVIANNQPVYFIRNHPPILFFPQVPFHLIIAGTGIQSSTSRVVKDVRQRWQENTAKYSGYFNDIGMICKNAYKLIRNGEMQNLGSLMVKNHELLQKIGVSCNELDNMVEVALNSGASGAKLSGAGRGGNMIALVPPQSVENVTQSLYNFGAVHVINSEIQPEIG